jgi:CMP-N,N'-diacetyllegionaminic acid synthase
VAVSIIAVIPARGGSKRILRKNIKTICGKPLIYWTIEAAINSPSIDQVFVSTEDEEIATISRDLGAEVPYLRPKELAMDSTPAISTVMHTLEKFTEYKQVLLLQPTSPLRTVEDIEGICQLQKINNKQCVVSVCRTSIKPYLTFQITTEGILNPIMKVPSLKLSQHNHPKYWRLNGAMYLANCDWLRKNVAFITSETIGYLMPSERSIDVDTKMDWDWAEFLMEKSK